MRVAALCGCLAGAWLLVACAALPRAGPDAGEVAAQAALRAGGRSNSGVQFDIIRIDGRTRHVLADRRAARFSSRFKKYAKPPALKIAVGDTVSVILWESGAGGLFTAGAPALPPGGAAAAMSALEQAEKSPSGASTTIPGAIPGAIPGGGGSAASGSGAANPADELFVAPGGNTAATTPGNGGAAPVATLPTTTPLSPEAADLAANAAQLGRSGTRVPAQQVGPDGAISVPFAGRIPVAGDTPEAVQTVIEHHLAGRALDPQALVLIADSVANTVSVTGSVVDGARVPLTIAGERLLQVIAAAGGARGPVRDIFVKLSRGGITATIPLAKLVADPAEDIYAWPGDVLTLVRVPQTFTVFGATGRNAEIPFDADHLNLAEALAKSGGLLDDRADPRGVFLFRYEPDAIVRAFGQPIASDAPRGLSPVVYRLDLADPHAYHYAREFAMHDKDIVFVANAKVAPLYKFFAILSNITGPVTTGFVTCYYAKC